MNGGSAVFIIRGEALGFVFLLLGTLARLHLPRDLFQNRPGVVLQRKHRHVVRRRPQGPGERDPLQQDFVDVLDDEARQFQGISPEKSLRMCA